jgi:hypothetical protein
MRSEIMQKHYKLATEYRAEQGFQGGVVVIFNDEVGGWMDKLRDPQHWAPGCIAIDVDGNTWLATGGSKYDGATHWDPVKQAA